MSSAQPASTLRVMPREMRLMTERVFSLTSLPKGFFLAVQDAVMYSERLGLGGFAQLAQRFEHLKRTDPARITVVGEENETLRLDAAGQHAWFVLPSLVDLLGELVQRFGMGRITVIDALDPTELRVAVPFGARSGLSVTFKDGEAPQLTAVPRRVTGDVRHDEPLLWELLQDGAPIEAELWWRIYHLAQKALAPDSVVSRRHAGPLIVNDDGTVIGRKDNDDETDISFLTSPRIGEMETEGTPS